MLRVFLVSILFVALGAGAARANDLVDCHAKNYENRIVACSRIITNGFARRKMLASAYRSRGFAYYELKQPDKAIQDFDRAIDLTPRYAEAFNNRASAWRIKHDFARALSDHKEAIRLKPELSFVYANLGRTYSAMNDHERAVQQYSTAIQILPDTPIFYSERGLIFELRGDRARALADFRRVVELPTSSRFDEQRKEIAKERISRLMRPDPQVQPSAPKPASSSGQRIALVIGNAKYGSVDTLANPDNDVHAMADALRRLGFTDVLEQHNLSKERMNQVLKEFGDKAERSSWAVIYFAGHGMEMSGVTYVIPTDAELKRDAHVPEETVSLTQLQAKVDAATKLGLVILDSCRNNPFLRRMARGSGASRAITGGLAPVEPEGNVLVAYSSKHGTTALDGTGKHSPFTEALLEHIGEPGLEINFLFRKVRDAVIKKTNREQEPFLYGSLSAEPLYFKPPN